MWPSFMTDNGTEVRMTHAEYAQIERKWKLGMTLREILLKDFDIELGGAREWIVVDASQQTVNVD
jgi:hypothetical protein